MVVEGKKAPAFKLPATGGDKVALSDFKGKVVVLYFYPRDNTPGCTVEAQDFQNALSRLKRKGAVVVGVSKDSIESHEKFASKYKLEFPLLSDDGSVMEKYGAWGEKNMYGKKIVGIIRTTVVIGSDGKIVRVFPKVRVKGHVDKVLEAVDEAKAIAAGKPPPKTGVAVAAKKAGVNKKRQPVKKPARRATRAR